MADPTPPGGPPPGGPPPTPPGGGAPPTTPGPTQQPGEEAIQSLEEALNSLKVSLQAVWQVAGQVAQAIGQMLSSSIQNLAKSTKVATDAIGSGGGGPGGKGLTGAVEEAGKKAKELGTIASAIGYAFDTVLLKAIRGVGDYLARVLSPNVEAVTGGLGKLDGATQRTNVALKTLAVEFERGQQQALEPFKQALASIAEGLAQIDPQLVTAAGAVTQMGSNVSAATSFVADLGLKILYLGAAVEIGLPLLNKLGDYIGSALIANAKGLAGALSALTTMGINQLGNAITTILGLAFHPLTLAIATVAIGVGVLTAHLLENTEVVRKNGESLDGWINRLRGGNEEARRLAEAYDRIKDSITITTESLRAAREESTALARGDDRGAAAAVNRLNAIKLEIQQRQELVEIAKNLMKVENLTQEQADIRARELVKEERYQQEINKLITDRNQRLDERARIDQASLAVIEKQLEYQQKLLEIDRSRSQGRQLAAEIERERAAGGRDIEGVIAAEKQATQEVLKRQEIAHEERQLRLRDLEEQRVREQHRIDDIKREEENLERIRSAGAKTAETAEKQRLEVAKRIAEVTKELAAGGGGERGFVLGLQNELESLLNQADALGKIRDKYLATRDAAAEVAKYDEDIRIRLEKAKAGIDGITGSTKQLTEEEKGQEAILRRHLELGAEINKRTTTEQTIVRSIAELEEARLRTAERRLQVQKTQSETRGQVAEQAGVEAGLTGNIPQLIQAAREQTEQYYEQRRIRLEELASQQRNIADREKQTQGEISSLERAQVDLRRLGLSLSQQDQHALELKKQLLVDLRVQQQQNTALVERELADRTRILTAQRELQQLQLQRPPLEQARADAVLGRAAANFGGDVGRAIASGSGAGFDPARFEEQYKRAAKQIAEIMNKPQLSEADVQMLGVQAGIAESATQRQQQYGRGGSAIGAPEVRRREQEIADVRERAASRLLELNAAQIKAKEEEIAKGKDATSQLSGAATQLHTAGTELIAAAKALKEQPPPRPERREVETAETTAKPPTAQPPQAQPAPAMPGPGEEIPVRDYLARLPAATPPQGAPEIPVRDYLATLPPNAWPPAEASPAAQAPKTQGMRDPFERREIDTKPLRDPFARPELEAKPPEAPAPKPAEVKPAAPKPPEPTQPIYVEPTPRTEGEKAGWAAGQYPTGAGGPRMSASGRELPTGEVREFGRVYEGPVIRREDMAKTNPPPERPAGFFTGEPRAVRDAEEGMLGLTRTPERPYEPPRAVHERSRTERVTPAPAQDQRDTEDLLARARKAPEIPRSSIQQGESRYTGKTSFGQWDLDDPQGRGRRELSWTPGAWATPKTEPSKPQPPPVAPDWSSVSTAGKEAVARGEATATVGPAGQVNVQLGKALEKSKSDAGEVGKTLSKGIEDVKLTNLEKLKGLLEQSGTFVTTIKTGMSGLSDDIDKATSSLEKYVDKLKEAVQIAGNMPNRSSSGGSVDATQSGPNVMPSTSTGTAPDTGIGVSV